MSEKSFFGGKAAPFLAACCAILWSCAFPLIKTGLSEFAISSDDTFSQMLFAGVRFIAAGFCVLLISPASGKRSAAEKKICTDTFAFWSCKHSTALSFLLCGTVGFDWFEIGCYRLNEYVHSYSGIRYRIPGR